MVPSEKAEVNHPATQFRRTTIRLDYSLDHARLVHTSEMHAAERKKNVFAEKMIGYYFS